MAKVSDHGAIASKRPLGVLGSFATGVFSITDMFTVTLLSTDQISFLGIVTKPLVQSRRRVLGHLTILQRTPDHLILSGRAQDGAVVACTWLDSLMQAHGVLLVTKYVLVAALKEA